MRFCFTSKVLRFRGGGKRGRIEFAMDTKPKQGDSPEVLACLGFTLPSLTEYINAMSAEKAEEYYEYIMGQKNGDRIVEFFGGGIDHTAVTKAIVIESQCW